MTTQAPSNPSPSPDCELVRVPAAASTEKLRELLRQATENGCARLIVDVSEDNHPNSMKIGVLIRFKNRMVRRGGDLRLVGAGGRTLEMLRITRLDTVFELFADVDAARRSFD